MQKLFSHKKSLNEKIVSISSWSFDVHFGVEIELALHFNLITNFLLELLQNTREILLDFGIDLILFLLPNNFPFLNLLIPLPLLASFALNFLDIFGHQQIGTALFVILYTFEDFIFQFDDFVRVH